MQKVEKVQLQLKNESNTRGWRRGYNTEKSTNST